jgi:hypothetical protein
MYTSNFVGLEEFTTTASARARPRQGAGEHGNEFTGRIGRVRVDIE